MSIFQTEFLHSSRGALKRGLARQAMRHGAAAQADLPALFKLLAGLRPNKKALERMALRLSGRKGVLRVAVGPRGLVLITRAQAEITTCSDDITLFAEPALIYTQTVIHCEGISRYSMTQCSFSTHALERLVERGKAPLDTPLLPAVDAEAVAILRGFRKNRQIEHDDGTFIQGVADGLWAGCIDHTVLDPDWGLVFPDPAVRIPIFSARTFLGPDEIRPMVWLRWKERA